MASGRPKFIRRVGFKLHAWADPEWLSKWQKLTWNPEDSATNPGATTQPALKKQRKTDDAWKREVSQSLEALLRKAYLSDELAEGPHRVLLNRARFLSQHEEDGIVIDLVRRAGTATKMAVELGSGPNGGNSGALARELGWRVLLVEGDEEVANAARSEFAGSQATVASAWISPNEIDRLLTEHGFVGEIDYLGIDIDGLDYWLWEALSAVNPRVVGIEYNSAFGATAALTVPNDATFSWAKAREEGLPITYHGASLQALWQLARRKGYRLVAVDPTGANAFFVRNDLALELTEISVLNAFRAHRNAERRGPGLGLSAPEVIAWYQAQDAPLEEISD
jgi:hypothetical protein